MTESQTSVNFDVIHTVDNETLTISKSFKLIVLSGYTDYDIEPSFSILHTQPDGTLFEDQEILYVKVMAKNVGVQTNTAEELLELPDKTYLCYRIDGSERIPIVNFTVDTDILKKVKNYLTVELVQDSLILDYVRIECLRDGQNGSKGIDLKDSREQCVEPGDAYFDENGTLHILLSIDPISWKDVHLKGENGENGTSIRIKGSYDTLE
jgi:hypothetical protein